MERGHSGSAIRAAPAAAGGEVLLGAEARGTARADGCLLRLLLVQLGNNLPSSGARAHAPCFLFILLKLVSEILLSSISM